AAERAGQLRPVRPPHDVCSQSPNHQVAGWPDLMSGWRSSPLRRAEAAAISMVGYRICAALGATLTWRVEGLQHYDEVVLGGHQPIMAFWHGRILPATIY